MSLPTVRSGATDPREVEKFVDRGVDVFTRRYLHSKLVVGDRFAIAGSANVSIRSRDLLDEAAATNSSTVSDFRLEFL
jgi:phosphatidylserine/phosphatidylglycerophosphate/cardiolipin synthase-like enzyme